MREFYAHSRKDNSDKSAWQRLEDHLRQTASLAREFAGAWNAGNWGHLAGLWHDIGKYSREFQQKIRAAGGEEAHVEASNRVDHSTAGAQLASRRLSSAGKVLAYVIAGHHGGLPDGISTQSCLQSRLEKVVPDYGSCPEVIQRPLDLSLPFELSPERAAVRLSMFIRMLYSSLVDADFLDTEAFMDPQRSRQRQGYGTLRALASGFFQRLDQLKSEATSHPVNDKRAHVLHQCLLAAAREVGLFSLTVPTGGGKTLSSMAFALTHALKHSLRRVIYVIPFTSIIEQNAGVFREFLGEDAVLEHHSNFEPREEDRRSRLAAENWDAPVVVTTNVQFFESLFANRSSQCRKLHNIAESVVILDEVQTLPPAYLLPCLEALRELSDSYRVSIVLCSATQPAVQKRSDFLMGLDDVNEIIDEPQKLADTMKRTEVTVLPRTTDIELASCLSQHEQVLCVVNTRLHARNLYEEMSDKTGLFHLSALMCPVHRRIVLDEIRTELSEAKACRVISTQLIEAGVDIDFPVVFRSVAGIDSIAQAAGRCNREGKLEKGQVFVFEPEAGIPAGHFRQTAQAAESVIRRHAEDILSLTAIEEYFRLYYWTKGEALDEEGILEMLHEGCGKGDFPFKSVAEKFQLIKQTMKPVVIPFDDEARSLIQALRYADYPSTISRKLQKYTVSIQPRQWDSLLSSGSIELIAEMFPVLVDSVLYSRDLGLCAEGPETRNPEDLLI